MQFPVQIFCFSTGVWDENMKTGAKNKKKKKSKSCFPRVCHCLMIGDRVMEGEDERAFLPHPSVAAAAGLTAVTRCDGSPSRGSAVKGAAANESARE